MQIMPYEDAKTYRINPFDLTKIWPHSDYPLIKVGRMVLDRNPQNFFAEIEQAAFSPSNFVPGIAASPDKMLLGRIFSYPDAHRYRIGTNFAQLPVNAPHAAPVNNYSHDGSMRYNFNDPPFPLTHQTAWAVRMRMRSALAKAAGSLMASWYAPPTPCVRMTMISRRHAPSTR